MGEAHCGGLECLSLRVLINRIYQPIITVTGRVAYIQIRLAEKLHHPAFAVYGSVYFKMLDDPFHRVYLQQKLRGRSAERQRWIRCVGLGPGTCMPFLGMLHMPVIPSFLIMGTES